MTKTLADMTADERQACVGMWAEWAHGDGQMALVVIEEIHPVRDFAGCVVPGVRYVEIPRHQLSTLTPRNDLPRAWNPDGTPVKGKWVDGHMWWNEPGDDSQTVDLIGAECLGTGEMQGMDKWPENVTPAVSDEDIQVRRFITEWEDTNE